VALAKLICNIDENLLKQLDAYAASLHITRTAAVSVLISTSLQTQNGINVLSELMQAYKDEQSAKGTASEV